MDGGAARNTCDSGMGMLATMHAQPGRTQRPEGPAVDGAQAQAPTLEAFLDGVAPRAFRFAELGLRNRDDTLDAVQDAMMKMLAYGERPAQEWTPLFWTVLRSRIIDLQRRRRYRLNWFTAGSGDIPEDVAIEWADPRPGPARAHDGREAYTLFVAALGELPRRQREAFGLRVLEELDVANTARVMGCSEGSVKTHLFRARDALQKRLEDFR